jgi:osmotically-inducible protein OsmY
MNSLRVLAISLVAALGAAQLAGCSTGSPSAGASRTTGEAVDDAALTAKVKAAIAADAGLKDAARVNVNTFRGLVQLAGFVDSPEEARRAAEAAKSVQGVKELKNDLVVAPPARG